MIAAKAVIISPLADMRFLEEIIDFMRIQVEDKQINLPEVF
jgi:hypothetical protein